MSTLIERLSARARDPKYATDEGQTAGRGGSPSPIAAPATAAQIAAAEASLGFRLPSLLRQIFQEVGNGGFGPGDGLRGLSPGPGDAPDSLVGQYVALQRKNLAWPVGLLPLCVWGSGIASYVDSSLPDAPVIRLDPNMPRVDVTARVPATRHYDRDASVSEACWVESPSLEVWLEAWADGRPLFYLAYGGPDDGEEDEEGNEEEDATV